MGISVNDHQPETAVEAVRSGLIDTLQVIDNVFDASPADELLPACAEHGVGVMSGRAGRGRADRPDRARDDLRARGTAG